MQVSKLVSFADYIQDYLKVQKKFKTQGERKKFLKDKNVKFVRHPKTREEMIAVEEGCQMLTGKRISAARVKEQDHTGDRQGSKEAFDKASASVNVDERINMKAGPDCFVSAVTVSIMGVLLKSVFETCDKWCGVAVADVDWR